MTNIILTQPQGISGVPGTSTEDIIIPSIGDAPNNVITIDTSEYAAVKWIYTLIDKITDKILMAEVLAIQRPGSPGNATHNQYSIIGDRIKHTVDVNLIGSELALEVTNLHINELISSVTQIRVTSPTI